MKEIDYLRVTALANLRIARYALSQCSPPGLYGLPVDKFRAVLIEIDEWIHNTVEEGKVDNKHGAGYDDAILLQERVRELISQERFRHTAPIEEAEIE